MITYAEFSPTGFDSAGAFLPGRQKWFVAPVSRTRDSEALDESNFESCLKSLGGESNYVEVHRFGHWGPGWFEIILIKPTAKKTIAIAEDIGRALADYPVLDEEDFSEREFEERIETIENCCLPSNLKSLDELPEDYIYQIWQGLSDSSYITEEEVTDICESLGFVDIMEEITYCQNWSWNRVVRYIKKHRLYEIADLILENEMMSEELEEDGWLSNLHDFANSFVPENQLALF